jgi:hypothetical protein
MAVYYGERSIVLRHHPLTQRLDTDTRAMSFGQLLPRQCRAKVRIALANQGQHRAMEHFAKLAGGGKPGTAQYPSVAQLPQT